MVDGKKRLGGFVLSGVGFGYERGRPVLSGVATEAGPGRVTAVLGPNGAGKTTLVRLMLGLLRPWSGEVRFGGERVGVWSARERAGRLAYVPQRSGVSFGFTVREVVAMGRFAVGGGGEAVDAALEACGLSGLAGRVFNALSVGQQQRVLLARAVGQLGAGGASASPLCSGGLEGKGLLADEPGSAMDLRRREEAMGLLRGLASAGMTVVVVVHDLNAAARWADDVWLLEGGRVAASGSTDEVLRAEVLEPVYGVGLTELRDGAGRRAWVVDRMGGWATTS